MTWLQLTHWGRVTHICISKLTTMGSDNSLLPGQHQAIIWTNAGILLIGPLWTKFSDILIKIDIYSFKKMHLKTSSGKWRPLCLSLNVLNRQQTIDNTNADIYQCQITLLLIDIKGWINNHTNCIFMWDIITHPYPNLNNSSLTNCCWIYGMGD